MNLAPHPSPDPPPARHRLTRPPSAFTLLELMLAIAIFAGVLTAIYSTWTAILRGSRVAQAASADIQRSRIAVQALEQALVGAEISMLGANARHFALLLAPDESEPILSFVSRLPESFPRAGRFGDLTVRRVTFTLEPDLNDQGTLLLRQTPLLFEPDIDEQENPLVLARNVIVFEMAFWGQNSNEWESEWPYTNQFPRLVRFSLGLGAPNRTHLDPASVVTRLVVIPAGNRPAGQPVAPGSPPAAVPDPIPDAETPPPDAAPSP
jgi:type II secretion system protein J